MPVPGCLQEVAATQPCPFSDFVPRLPLFPGTVPCRMVFTSPSPLNTCQNHLSFSLWSEDHLILKFVVLQHPLLSKFLIKHFFSKWLPNPGWVLLFFCPSRMPKLHGWCQQDLQQIVSWVAYCVYLDLSDLAGKMTSRRPYCRKTGRTVTALNSLRFPWNFVYRNEY